MSHYRYTLDVSVDRAVIRRFFLVAVLILAIMLCMPSLHTLIGVDTADAFDQGALLPRMSAQVRVLAHVVWAALLFSAAVGTARPCMSASVVSAGSRSVVRPAARKVRMHAARVTYAPEDADGDTHPAYARQVTPVIPALRPVRFRTTAEGLRRVLARHSRGGMSANPRV